MFFVDFNSNRKHENKLFTKCCFLSFLDSRKFYIKINLYQAIFMVVIFTMETQSTTKTVIIVIKKRQDKMKRSIHETFRQSIKNYDVRIIERPSI